MFSLYASSADSPRSQSVSHAVSQQLGNITAVGIAAAWLYSLTLLPALISLLPYRIRQSDQPEWSQRAMDRLADFVIGNYRKLFVGMGVAVLGLVAFIPTIDFNDQWVEYFDERIEFRTDSDEAQEFFGLYPIEYSVPSSGPGGVSEPEFLANLEAFADFLRDPCFEFQARCTSACDHDPKRDSNTRECGDFRLLARRRSKA